MNKVKKKLAFGCMRLPMTDGRVDEPQFSYKHINGSVIHSYSFLNAAVSLSAVPTRKLQ